MRTWSADNPFSPPLSRLFDRLASLEYITWEGDNNLSEQKDRLTEFIKNDTEQRSFPIPFSGTNFLIDDPCEIFADGWARPFPVAGRSASGLEVLSVLDEMCQIHNAWGVAQSYESFETFLFDELAAFAEHSSGRERVRILPWTGNVKPSVDWSVSIRRQYRRKPNQEMLDAFRHINNRVEELEARNFMVVPLQAWYAVTEKVRHAVTHSHRVIPRETLEALDPAQHRQLRKGYPGSETDRGYVLQIDVESARKALKIFGGYAFMLYRLTCESLGLEWRGGIGEPQDGAS